jgi:spoIIIJ-associated protein
MEWVEITAKSVEEATRKALDQLGVLEGDAEIVVVEEPKTGLFGRVRGEARVRARIRPAGPRPKRSRRGRSGRGGSSRPEGSSNTNGNAAAKESTREPRPEGASPSRSRSRSRSRRGRGGGTQTKEGATSGVAVREATGSPDREDTMAEGMTLEEQGAIGKQFLEGLVGAFGLDATVEIRLLDAETVELAVDGADLGILVGPRGTTLSAVQEVTRTAVQSKCPSRTDRILVDVARYRERRAKALTEFTTTVAAEVVASGEERHLEPMSAADRKVVHDAATEIDGVATRSEGEDPNRFVVISPA